MVDSGVIGVVIGWRGREVPFLPASMQVWVNVRVFDVEHNCEKKCCDRYVWDAKSKDDE